MLTRTMLTVTVLAAGAVQALAADPRPEGVSEEFYCAADWDNDGSIADDAGDLLACLNAAKAYIGTERSARVWIGEGDFVFCSPDLPGGNPCPYALAAGMSIVGATARWRSDGRYPSGYAPQDLTSVPSGGTWIDGNGVANSADGIFTGVDVRGLRLQDLGFKNMGKALVFDPPGVEGLSFATLENLAFYGVPQRQCQPHCKSAGTDTFVQLGVPQHVSILQLKGRFCDECILVTQSAPSTNGGNSEFRSIYLQAYTDPTYCMKWTCSSGNLSVLSVDKFQCNHIGSARTGYGFVVQGTDLCAVDHADVRGLVFDGGSAADVSLSGHVVQSRIALQDNGEYTATIFEIGDGVSDNIFESADGDATATVADGAGLNLFTGMWRHLEDRPVTRGLWFDPTTGQTTLAASRVWLSDGTTLLRATGSAASGPAAWADATTTCAAACSGLGAQACQAGYLLGSFTPTGCTSAAAALKLCLCR